MVEPPIRYATAASISYIAARLGLRNDPSMQDWEFEVAEATDLNRYLSLFAEVPNQEDVRFTLADMIIQAFEESDSDLNTDHRWAAFLDSLVKNIDVHAHQLWYWSSWDVELEEAWRVTPFMRNLSREHLDNGDKN